MHLKSLALLVATLGCAAAPSAFAFYAPTLNISVTDQTDQLAQTDWLYQYTVNNLSTCFGNCGDTVLGKPIYQYILGVNTFSIPFFDDGAITDIKAPAGWSYQILATNTFNLANAGTLQWSATADNAYVALGASLAGFSYHTTFAPGKGPFQTGFGGGDTFAGDPAIPMSPHAILAGIGNATQVPEPATGVLMLAGLGALLARRRAGRRA